MSVNKTQFDPAEQVVTTFDDLAKAMIDARACIDRVEWLNVKLVAEVERAREQAEALEIYTEEQAAAMLAIEARQLGDLRRRHDLPHVVFGKHIRYTKENVTEIVRVFEIRKFRAVSSNRVLRKAA